MSYKSQTFVDGEILYAKPLNNMDAALVEMQEHILDINNPHNTTAEQVGARPNTWIPTAEEVGARPADWTPTAEQVGAATLADVNAAVKKAAPRNLLDNSDFRIAQAGYCGHHGGELYVADRWTTEATELNVSKSANHIDISVVSGTPVIMQKCTDEMAEYLMGKTVTIALKDRSGNIRIASGVVTSTEMCVVVYGDDFTFGISLFPSSKQLFRLIVNAGHTASIQWVAVYEGEYTAETLPEYQPKGYGAELAECMRYYYRNYYGEMPQAGFASLYAPLSGKTISVMFPTPMRVTPTITLYNPVTGHSGCVADWATDADVIAIVIYSNEHNFILGGDMTEGQMIAYNYEASADL